MRTDQQGLALPVWLAIIAVFGVVIIAAIRIVPAYIEHRTIMQSVQSVYDQLTESSTPNQIRQDIGRRFMVNSIETLSASDIVVHRQDGRYTFHVAYEYRTPLFGNLDAVVVFEKVIGGSGE